MTKICKICKQEKDVSEFYTHRSGYLQHGCKKCYIEKTLINKNIKKEKYTQYNKDRWINEDKPKRKEKLSGLKQKCVEYLGGKCVKCGYDKCIFALDFHHKNDKSRNLSSYLQSFRYKPVEFFKDELDKCDLLCANCHRELHHGSDV